MTLEGGGRVAVTAAGLAGAAIMGSVLTKGMFIAWLSASSVTSGSHLDALDRQALEIGRGVGGIEHLAVEKGLLAARGRRRDIGGDDAERLGGLAPQVLP